MPEAMGMWMLDRKLPELLIFDNLVSALKPIRDGLYGPSRFAVMVKWYHETLPTSSREFNSR